MNSRHIIFAGLSVAAPGAFLVFYPVYRRSELLAFASMILGVALSFVLLGWSLWSLRRRPGRALLGLVVCGYCFWQVLVIPGFIEAVKSQREKQTPNKSVERTGMSRSAQSLLQRPWRLIPVAHLGR
jgi:hypothetical protein